MKILKVKNLICVLFVLSIFSNITVAASETEENFKLNNIQRELMIVTNLINRPNQNDFSKNPKENNSKDDLSGYGLKIILTRIRPSGGPHSN
jgi:hypothetical protein